MARTFRDRYVAALVARGHIIVSDNGRHVKLTRTPKSDARRATFYFVGTHGSVRYGPSVSASLAVNDKFKLDLLNEALPQKEDTHANPS